MHNRRHFRANWNNKVTFPCQICDRNTRDVGQGVDDMCSECFEIAGIDNSVNDNNFQPGTEDHAAALREAERLLAKAVKLGSDGAKITANNDFLWGDALARRAARRAAVEA